MALLLDLEGLGAVGKSLKEPYWDEAAQDYRDPVSGRLWGPNKDWSGYKEPDLQEALGQLPAASAPFTGAANPTANPWGVGYEPEPYQYEAPVAEWSSPFLSGPGGALSTPFDPEPRYRVRYPEEEAQTRQGESGMPWTEWPEQIQPGYDERLFPQMDEWGRRIERPALSPVEVYPGDLSPQTPLRKALGGTVEDLGTGFDKYFGRPTDFASEQAWRTLSAGIPEQLGGPTMAERQEEFRRVGRGFLDPDEPIEGFRDRPLWEQLPIGAVADVTNLLPVVGFGPDILRAGKAVPRGLSAAGRVGVREAGMAADVPATRAGRALAGELGGGELPSFGKPSGISGELPGIAGFGVDGSRVTVMGNVPGQPRMVRIIDEDGVEQVVTRSSIRKKYLPPPVEAAPAPSPSPTGALPPRGGPPTGPPKPPAGELPGLPPEPSRRVFSVFDDAATKEGRPRKGGIYDLIAPTESTQTGLLRGYEGKTGMAGLELRREVDNGNALLRQAGAKGAKVGPRFEVRDTPEMRELYVALHGEGPVPPKYQAVYDDLKRIMKTEEAETIGADPKFIPRDDYFYRGWRAPKETNAGASKVGATPGFKKPRVDATFRELLDEGWQPASWNPYEMAAMRVSAGKVNRLQQDLVAGLKETNLALLKSEAPDGWRVPHIGPAFEGKPFAYTPGVKGTDSAELLAGMDTQGARLGFTEQWAVPSKTADTLEAIFGRAPDLGAWDTVLAVPRFGKRAKLFGSLFQQVDFATRTLGSTTAAVVDDLAEVVTKAATLHPSQAVQSLFKAGRDLLSIPVEVAKLPIANVSSMRRAALRDELLGGKAIFADRPGITLKGVGDAGAKYGEDVSLITRDFMKELRSEAKGAVALRRVGNINGAMQRGLFDGVYVQAQTTSLKKFILPRIMNQHPDWTDGQIMAAAVAEVNKMFSTLGEYQTIIKNPFVKKVARDLIFSTNESEALLRGAFSTVTGPNKRLWIEYHLGVYLALAATASVIHKVTTGEWLPTERLNPLETGGYGPLPVQYRAKFLAPDIPLKGRGGTNVTLDLVNQMDTVFRLLDPKSFATAREGLGPRAATTALTQKDFFGRPLSPWETAGQVAADLFEPIGGSQLRGALGVGPENEARLGKAGQGIQATGLNLRAEPNAALRDRIARESGLKKADGSPVTKWSDLEPSQVLEVRRKNPEFTDELTRRRDEAAGQGSEFAARSQRTEELNKQFTDAQLADDAVLAPGGSAPNPEKWRDNRAERQFGLRQRKEEIYASVPDRPARDALDKFYAILDANTTDPTIVKGTDWDKVDAAVAQLTPEEQDYIARNTGLGGTETEKRYRAETKVVADSGYFDGRDKIFADPQWGPRLPGYEQGDTYDTWYQRGLAEYIKVAQERGYQGEGAVDKAKAWIEVLPFKKTFDDGYKKYIVRPWLESNPEAALLAWRWGYYDPPKEIEEWLIQVAKELGQ